MSAVEVGFLAVFIAESCLADMMLLTGNNSTGRLGPIGHFVEEGAAMLA